jgi:hypothetical protein
VTQLFPVLVVVLEGLAGVVYFAAWWTQGDPRHGWLAMVWGFYALAAVGLAMVGK